MTQYLIHLDAYRNSLVCLFERKCKQDSLYNFLAVSIICFPIQVLTYGWRGILRQYFTFLSRVNNLTCFICFCNSRVEQQPWYQSVVGHNFPLRFSDFCKGAIAPRINFPFNKGLLLNPHQRPTLAKIVKISPPFTFWPSYRFICTLLEKKNCTENLGPKKTLISFWRHLINIKYWVVSCHYQPGNLRSDFSW